jgi:hypothetical protein
MTEFPLRKEIVAEAEARANQKAIISFLESRFSAVPEDITTAVQQTVDLKKLTKLIVAAARCKELSEFRERLQDQIIDAN